MYLEQIVGTKQREVEELKERFSLSGAEREIAAMPPCRGFARTLKEKRRRPVGLIAEVKKASPSKGLIREDFDPVRIARTYEAHGADCLSVLTDEEYFQGSKTYLSGAREAVGIPLLRKDFIIDYRQVYEARLIGADCVLLIAAILDRRKLGEFLKLAEDLGMDALVEVHDRAELESVLELEAKLIGINNRNLNTFVTDIRHTEQLIPHVPRDATIVSESGISSRAEVEYLGSLGVHAVLVGEHLMRQPDIGRAVDELMGPVDAKQAAE
jgi:indole-3-glycerol phosphate synthase